MKRHLPSRRLVSSALSLLALTVPALHAGSGVPAAARPPAAVQPADGEPLALDVYPRISTEGPVSVRLRVEPNVRSRNVEISWWSADGLGGSRMLEVDGDRAAVRYEFPIKRIDPGEYEVTAVLIRSDGTRVRRAATVVVVGRGF